METSERGVSEYVFYTIFELANHDVRSALLSGRRGDLAWVCQTAHDMAVGVSQLHTQEIAHNDLRPSNVLCFSDTQKIADLGRATSANHAGPWDPLMHPGARAYRPPECWGYGYIQPRQYGRVTFDARAQSDLFLLGAMMLFLVSEISYTQKLRICLRPEYDPGNNGRVSFVDALPHINVAHAKALSDVKSEIESAFDAKYSVVYDEYIELCKMLVDPDPSVRGDPRMQQIGAPRSSLQRIISRLDYLGKKASLIARK